MRVEPAQAMTFPSVFDVGLPLRNRNLIKP